MDLARDERAEFADLLEGLSPEQWEAPSLCAGWTVREVVAHAISYDELSWSEVGRRLVRAGGNPDGANALGVDEYGRRTPDELVALLRAHLTPRGLTAAMGGRIGLVDGLIHQQDVRRPLGLPRSIPEERLRPALTLALFAPPIRGVLRVHDLRLEATDIAWSSGPLTRRRGTVRGTAEALVMAIAGRRVADDLEGDGVPLLAPRLG
ncbi:maleylpyruvate isomerase family mycothiol-dependent enzyme [Actinomycetospora soli]|uniref:maleylpyruvate isomerase family mycothiol-dependent enzyme n=1 Tax=Actinomycetospora soli TaxID=2893887 RepID=UPI001E331711|nr:maleylpyruvate isomerase family mycothiol-dependent enzyme [Actinomycetospora soli]MCD2185661.1 maleylpyruvate isomerase family mycothiol-dependent enzyme [Actinomycetospora soli]